MPIGLHISSNNFFVNPIGIKVLWLDEVLELGHHTRKGNESWNGRWAHCCDKQSINPGFMKRCSNPNDLVFQKNWWEWNCWSETTSGSTFNSERLWRLWSWYGSSCGDQPKLADYPPGNENFHIPFLSPALLSLSEFSGFSRLGGICFLVPLEGKPKKNTKERKFLSSGRLPAPRARLRFAMRRSCYACCKEWGLPKALIGCILKRKY